MKKNKLTLLITLLLAAITIYLIVSRRSGTIKEELKDFAIEDTGSVTRIFLADRSGHTILLDRLPSGAWKLNKKYFARPDAVSTLLETMKRLEVKSPVAKSAHNTIVKNLSGTGIKVEIYKDGDTTAAGKIYYVGGPNQEHDGTYMLLENSSVPFAMHIPGFRGFLTPRYFTEEQEWRDRSVFRYNEDGIRSVTVEYPQMPDSSFTINIKPLAVSGINKQPIPVDTVKAYSYLSFYKFIAFEGFPNKTEEKEKDSVITSAPFAVITVDETGGAKNSVKVFLKPINELSKIIEDDYGKPLKHDIERKYVLLNNNQDLVIVQDYVFNNLLKSVEYFRGN